MPITFDYSAPAGESAAITRRGGHGLVRPAVDAPVPVVMTAEVDPPLLGPSVGAAAYAPVTVTPGLRVQQIAPPEANRGRRFTTRRASV